MAGTGFVELIIAFVTLVFGVVSIIGGLIFRLHYHRKIDLEYLGWGILIVAIWNITNSDLGQTFFKNPSIAANIVFLSALFMPLPFLLYINEVQKKRYQKWYRIAEIFLSIEVVIFSILHFSHLCDFTKNMLPVMLVLILYVLIVLGTILADIRSGDIRKYLIVTVGMLCIWGAMFIRIISYFGREKMKSDAVLPAGLIFLLILAAVNTFHELINMERKKQHALMASEAKGRFLANMSHEIRTPINAVLGMDAMILRECKDTTIREYAMDIQNAGQTLLSLINDILDLSKIESGKLEILPEEYDLSSLLHDIMNMITMKAKDKGLVVNLSVDENLPSRFWGDDIRLRQVLVNIMNNAVKYTENGSVTLTVKSIDKCEENYTNLNSGIYDSNIQPDENILYLIFQIEDTGIGIKKEDIAKLFGEFERIEEERNRNIEGTGLGMSITTQLLELMGSKLQVESVYGQGSKFYFTLGQKVMNSEPIGNLGERIRKMAAEYSYKAAFTAPQAQVLVVDDNSVNRKVFTSLLKETKVIIDEAAGGIECIKMAEQKKYDVIFLDHMMPDLDGIETLHKLKGIKDCKSCDAVIIALTANADSGAREMYLKEGFDSFLSKPIIPDKLEKMLIQFIPDDKVIYEEIADNSIVNSDETDLIYSEKDVTMDELPQLDGIDWEYALLHLKDIGILKYTVSNFYYSMEQEADELTQFLQMMQRTSGEKHSEAMEQFEIKVHSMKSSAAMIGAVSLSGVAKMLEYAAKDGRTEMILSVAPEFLIEWQKMREILKTYVESDTEVAKTGIPMADLSEVLKLLCKIREAMQDMDIDKADETMIQIQKFRYPDTLTSDIEKLRVAVANIDTEETDRLTKSLEQKINKM